MFDGFSSHVCFVGDTGHPGKIPGYSPVNIQSLTGGYRPLATRGRQNAAKLPFTSCNLYYRAWSERVIHKMDMDVWKAARNGRCGE